MGKFSFPRLIVVPLSIHLLVEYISRQQISSNFLFSSLFMAVNPGNVAPSSNLFPSGCYTNAIQEQIAASHEFDGVRKEKERRREEKREERREKREERREKREERRENREPM